MPFEPIQAPNLSDAAADQIRKLIATDVLRPGDPLPGERNLSSRMGISRTSLRAALQTLVTEGLLKSRQGAGLWVSNDLGRSITDPLVTLIGSSPAAIKDYIRFRIMIESDCAADVAKNGTADERAQIASINEQMRQANEAGDFEASTSLDTEFHMAIVEATGNVVTIQVARSLQDLLQRSIRDHHKAADRSPVDTAALNDQHDMINDAIQTGNSKRARKAMAHHLTYFSDMLSRHEDAQKRAHTVARRKSWTDGK